MTYNNKVETAEIKGKTNFGERWVMKRNEVKRNAIMSGCGEWNINGDGTVTNKNNNITWVQAPWGMEYDGDFFYGEPLRLSWNKASKMFGSGVFAYKDREVSSLKIKDWSDCSYNNGYVKGSCRVQFAGFDDWRLPTADEWCTINFDGQWDYDIQKMLFPYDPGTAYWTANGARKTKVLFFETSPIVWKGWFGRPINDENADIDYPIMLMRKH